MSFLVKTILRSLAVLFAAGLLAFALAEDPIVGVMVGLGCIVLLLVAVFLRIALASYFSDEDVPVVWHVTHLG